MRLSSLIVLVTLTAAQASAQTTAQTCASWQGGFVYDARLSVAGGVPLATIRLVDPEALITIPVDTPVGARTLPILASSFELASAPGSHLLVTTNDLKGAVSGLRLAANGSPQGSVFTVYPAGERDRHIRGVLFDGRDFVVVVDTGTSIDDDLWLVRVGTDGVVAGEPAALALAEDALLLPGPTTGTIWIVEDRSETLPGRVVARVRAADASVGAAIDVGAGRVRGQAVAANGDLLVVRNPGGSSAAGLEISTVTGAGAVSAAMPFAPAGGAAVTGYWSVAARPVGGFLAVTSMPDDSAPEGTVLAGMALDAAGTPSAAPVFWAAGRNAALAGDRLLFVDRIEDGASASSHATAIAFDAAGTPGAPVVLAQARQRLVPRECGGGCGVASVNRRGPSVAGLLFLLVLGALVASGRPGSLRWRSGASSACARRRRRPAGGPGRGPPR